MIHANEDGRDHEEQVKCQLDWLNSNFDYLLIIPIYHHLQYSKEEILLSDADSDDCKDVKQSVEHVQH